MAERHLTKAALTRVQKAVSEGMKALEPLATRGLPTDAYLAALVKNQQAVLGLVSSALKAICELHEAVLEQRQ